jgi:hypothetical protein
MPVKALLTSEVGQPRRLGQVAFVVRHEHQLEVEAAQAHDPENIVEADRGAAGLPACDGGLGGAGPGGQLGLGEAGPPSRLTDQVATVRTHSLNITELL